MPSSGLRFFVFSATVLATTAVHPADPKATVEAIRASKLDLGQAFRVHGATLRIGLATLEIRDATALATPRVGSTVEVALAGDMSIHAEPPDPVEANQMRRFTGVTVLEAPLTTLVVASGDAAFLDAVLAEKGGADPSRTEQAAAAHKAWRASTERRGLDVDDALAQAALGDGIESRFRAAYCASPSVGRFFVVWNPADPEPYQIGRFDPVRLGAEDTDRAKKWIRRRQREGHSGSGHFEDLGDWNLWTSAAPPDSAGKPEEGGPGYQIDRYMIDVALEQDGEHLRARSQVALHTLAPGRVALPFTLAGDLVVESVKDESGKELFHVRDLDRVLVFLQGGAPEGAHRTLDFRYGGPALETFDRGVQTLRYTNTWYPNGGEVPRALYDVTLHCPKRFDLLASGRLVESGEEAGARFEHRLLEIPALAFSFQVGSFELRHEQVGHVALTVGFAKWPSGVDTKMQDSVLATLRDALVSYEKLFGAYPLDYLTVATVPGAESQGFPGFITYSHFLVAKNPAKAYWNSPYYIGLSLGRGDRLQILVHELAHQWWGNKIGWESYRDQWLSEALADYVAKQFTFYRLGEDELYLREARTEQRRALMTTAANGRAALSVGPVSLGVRLAPAGEDVYTAIVYSKGALVFDMLARELGEGEFLGMLRTLADKVGNRVIRTSTFFKALERMSGKSLEPFEREFVYGTGIPDIEYEHRGEKTGDAEWTVRGSARQSPSGHLEWTLARAGQTGWDARAAFVPDVDLAVDALTVDYRIDEEEDEKEPSPSEVLDDDAPIERAKGAVLIPAGWRGRTRLPLTGAPFEIRVEHDPKGFRFDDRGETLANFFELAETREALAGSAERAATRGEPEASETLFRRALAAPLEPPDKKRSSARIAAAHATRLDAHIHLGLCRVHLDQGKTDEAAADLEAAEKRLSGPENDALPEERAVLHARLALRRGDFAAAYRRLDTMRVEILQREGESSIDQARRAKFTTGWEGTGEAYALLAVAAHGSDHEEVCAAAREEARRRDADTRVLDALHPTGPANGAP